MSVSGSLALFEEKMQLQEDKRSNMPGNVLGSQNHHGCWVCQQCGWKSPKPNPSAKVRRNHKKHCGKSGSRDHSNGSQEREGSISLGSDEELPNEYHSSNGKANKVPLINGESGLLEPKAEIGLAASCDSFGCKTLQEEEFADAANEFSECPKTELALIVGVTESVPEVVDDDHENVPALVSAKGEHEDRGLEPANISETSEGIENGFVSDFVELQKESYEPLSTDQSNKSGGFEEQAIPAHAEVATSMPKNIDGEVAAKTEGLSAIDEDMDHDPGFQDVSGPEEFLPQNGRILEQVEDAQDGYILKDKMPIKEMQNYHILEGELQLEDKISDSDTLPRPMEDSSTIMHECSSTSGTKVEASSPDDKEAHLREVFVGQYGAKTETDKVNDFPEIVQDLKAIVSEVGVPPLLSVHMVENLLSPRPLVSEIKVVEANRSIGSCFSPTCVHGEDMELEGLETKGRDYLDVDQDAVNGFPSLVDANNSKGTTETLPPDDVSQTSADNIEMGVLVEAIQLPIFDAISFENIAYKPEVIDRAEGGTQTSIGREEDILDQVPTHSMMQTQDLDLYSRKDFLNNSTSSVDKPLEFPCLLEHFESNPSVQFPFPEKDCVFTDLSEEQQSSIHVSDFSIPEIPGSVDDGVLVSEMGCEFNINSLRTGSEEGISNVSEESFHVDQTIDDYLIAENENGVVTKTETLIQLHEESSFVAEHVVGKLMFSEESLVQVNAVGMEHHERESVAECQVNSDNKYQEDNGQESTGYCSQTLSGFDEISMRCSSAVATSVAEGTVSTPGTSTDLQVDPSPESKKLDSMLGEAVKDSKPLENHQFVANESPLKHEDGLSIDQAETTLLGDQMQVDAGVGVKDEEETRFSQNAINVTSGTGETADTCSSDDLKHDSSSLDDSKSGGPSESMTPGSLTYDASEREICKLQMLQEQKTQGDSRVPVDSERRQIENKNVCDLPSLMTLVEDSSREPTKHVNPVEQQSEEAEEPNDSLQAGWFPSLAQAINDSEGRKIDEEILEKTTNSSSEKIRMPLKSLLEEAHIENKKKTQKNNFKDAQSRELPPAASKVISSQIKGSPVAKAAANVLYSPSRLSVNRKDTRKKGKSSWLTFACCSSVN